MLWCVRLLLRFLLVGGVILVLIQLIPYGRDHSNPRTVQELKWNRPSTRALAQQGCFDCHSNLTEWPWWTNIAPISWLSARDVERGREALNFSDWQQPQRANLQEAIDAINGKHMPPLRYRLLNRDARLTDAERQQLGIGLAASWNNDPPGQP